MGQRRRECPSGKIIDLRDLAEFSGRGGGERENAGLDTLIVILINISRNVTRRGRIGSKIENCREVPDIFLRNVRQSGRGGGSVFFLFHLFTFARWCRREVELQTTSRLFR